jgi:hypothetical protein
MLILAIQKFPKARKLYPIKTPTIADILDLKNSIPEDSIYEDYQY